MFPRLPLRGPGILNNNFGFEVVNVGDVVTSADMTSRSGESRSCPRKKISFPSWRQWIIAAAPSVDTRHFPLPDIPFAALNERTYTSPRSGWAASDLN